MKPASLIACIFGLLFWIVTLVPADGQARDQESTNAIGMKLVRIQPGTFVMGTGDAPPKTREEWDGRDWDESPAHHVKISKPYYMGTAEVTNAQYEQFDPDHKKLRGKHGVSKADDEPVVMVTWQQAVDFCNWLSKKEGRPYRLPTEAEWEYACRAGTTTPYNTGDKLTPVQANFGLAADGKKRIRAVAVGRYKPNAWGLHDMHGNVAEWCLDRYGPYERSEPIDPVGRAGGWARVTRGWSYLPASHKLGAVRYCRSANRSGQFPEDANRVTGFRVVIGELPATKPLPVEDVPLHQRNVEQGPARKDGPDMAKPYFADLTKGLAVPKDAWGPICGAWNHYSTIAVCPNGDFGHRDERVMTSADGGKTWKVGAGDVRKAAGKYAIHPAVVERADGSFLAFLRGPDPMPAFVSKDEGETWEPVSTPFPGISVGQKAAALKLARGALLLVSFDNKRQLGLGGSSIRCVAYNEAWLKEGKPVAVPATE